MIRLTLKTIGFVGAVGLVILFGETGSPPGSSVAKAESDSCHATSQPEPVPGDEDSPTKDKDTTAEDQAGTPFQTDLLALPELVGVDEKLGRTAELDLVFQDEMGQPRILSDLVDRPTIILPVYYHCPTACQIMLGGLSSLVDDVPLDLGEKYRILAVSFDHDDTPAIAARTKNNYIQLIEKEFSPEYFMYLTGGRSEILALLNSVGYMFQQQEQHSFLHPNALIVLAEDGTIIRYLYGPGFLAFDIGMALTEADQGTPSLSIRKLMTYCFSYNQEKKTYTFSAVRYIMIGVMLLLALVMFLLLRKRRREA